MVTATVADSSGRLSVSFFNQRWREKQLPVGTEAVFFGKLDIFRNVRQMTNPVVDLIGSRTGKIIPVGNVPAYSVVPPGTANFAGGNVFDFKAMDYGRRLAEARAQLQVRGAGGGGEERAAPGVAPHRAARVVRESGPLPPCPLRVSARPRAQGSPGRT